MTNNPNQKALDEMELAQKKFASAFEHFDQMTRDLQSSFRAFQEAAATSINKDSPCYKQMVAKVAQMYGQLGVNSDSMCNVFSTQTAQNMILAGRKE